MLRRAQELLIGATCIAVSVVVAAKLLIALLPTLIALALLVTVLVRLLSPHRR